MAVINTYRRPPATKLTRRRRLDAHLRGGIHLLLFSLKLHIERNIWTINIPQACEKSYVSCDRKPKTHFHQHPQWSAVIGSLSPGQRVFRQTDVWMTLLSVTPKPYQKLHWHAIRSKRGKLGGSDSPEWWCPFTFTHDAMQELFLDISGIAWMHEEE